MLEISIFNMHSHSMVPIQAGMGPRPAFSRQRPGKWTTRAYKAKAASFLFLQLASSSVKDSTHGPRTRCNEITLRAKKCSMYKDTD